MGRDLQGQGLRGAGEVGGGDQPVHQAEGQGFLCAHRPSREDHVQSTALSDQARQTDRAAVDQRHAEAPAEHTEHGGFVADAQVAPERQFEAARHAVARDHRDDRLGKLQAGWPHRAVALRVNAVGLGRIATGDGVQIGSRTEVSAIAREQGDAKLRVLVEGAKGAGQGLRRRPVHGIAAVRAVDPHVQQRWTARDGDGGHGQTP